MRQGPCRGRHSSHVLFLLPGFAPNLLNTIGGLLNLCLGFRFSRKLPEHGRRITLRRLPVVAQNFGKTAGGLQTFCFGARCSREAFCFGAKRFSITCWAPWQWIQPTRVVTRRLVEVCGAGERTASGFLSFCLDFQFSRKGKGTVSKSKGRHVEGVVQFCGAKPFPKPARAPRRRNEFCGPRGAHFQAGHLPRQAHLRRNRSLLPPGVCFETGALPSFHFSTRLRPGGLLARSPEVARRIPCVLS